MRMTDKMSNKMVDIYIYYHKWSKYTNHIIKKKKKNQTIHLYNPGIAPIALLGIYSTEIKT